MLPRHILIFLVMFWTAAAHSGAELYFQVQPQATISNAPRLGVNLGEWTAWGAAQLSANVLKNPGFEGIIDRAIVIVKSADSLSFSDDTAWTKRPDGFWAGAHYDVRSGREAGKQGVLFDSKASGKNQLPEFIVAEHAPALQPGDAVSISRNNEAD